MGDRRVKELFLENTLVVGNKFVENRHLKFLREIISLHVIIRDCQGFLLAAKLPVLSLRPN